jgi:hypothetical protein
MKTGKQRHLRTILLATLLCCASASSRAVGTTTSTTTSTITSTTAAAPATTTTPTQSSVEKQSSAVVAGLRIIDACPLDTKDLTGSDGVRYPFEELRESLVTVRTYVLSQPDFAGSNFTNGTRSDKDAASDDSDSATIGQIDEAIGKASIDDGVIVLGFTTELDRHAKGLANIAASNPLLKVNQFVLCKATNSQTEIEATYQTLLTESTSFRSIRWLDRLFVELRTPDEADFARLHQKYKDAGVVLIAGHFVYPDYGQIPSQIPRTLCNKPIPPRYKDATVTPKSSVINMYRKFNSFDLNLKISVFYRKNERLHPTSTHLIYFLKPGTTTIIGTDLIFRGPGFDPVRPANTRWTTPLGVLPGSCEPGNGYFLKQGKYDLVVAAPLERSQPADAVRYAVMQKLRIDTRSTPPKSKRAK